MENMMNYLDVIRNENFTSKEIQEQLRNMPEPKINGKPAFSISKEDWESASWEEKKIARKYYEWTSIKKRSKLFFTDLYIVRTIKNIHKEIN